MAWDRVVPIPGRMAPARMRERLASALGPDLVRATRLLDVTVVSALVLANAQGGPLAFAGASLLTLTLHAVLKRLNDTRVELERRHRLAVIGQTASSVFHQLGRHHGAIGMYAHLLARGPRDGEGAWPPAIRAHADRILGTVDEANRVIDELLAFGQDRTLNLYPLAVGELLDECVEECRARASGRGIDVRVAAAPDETVMLDKHKIKQALGNVLDNAIDAAPPGSRVDVETTFVDGVVRIAIRDRGAGVAAEVRERLFTPFCTTKPDGVGLGLALAKELVDAHGGALAWEAADPGARFVFVLPRGR
jgi:signal transduction histidine kinase